VYKTKKRASLGVAQVWKNREALESKVDLSPASGRRKVDEWKGEMKGKRCNKVVVASGSWTNRTKRKY
jgi:hypothetical protein